MILLGFAAALILFFFLSYLGSVILNNYLIDSNYIYNSETEYIKELQDYVAKKQLAATDTSSLGKWAHDKSISHFTISRNRILIYDSTYSDSVVLGQTEAESLHYNWQYFHSVLFSDGNADVYIYANYEMKFYLFFYLFIGGLCVSVWLLFVVFAFQKEIRYIRQLSNNISEIEKGIMNSEIQVKGIDELAVLARGLNQMRLALIEKEENEKLMKTAQDKLVLGMSHDLRTPLTGLMTFIEIAQKQNQLSECKAYVNKAYSKATQIRTLSDLLFEFFLINSKQPIKMEAPEFIEYALGEYLSELCMLIKMDGFAVRTEHLLWQPVRIQICVDYLGRIIDNLVSNIKKYADPAIPVELSLIYRSSCIQFCIKNKISSSNQFVEGTGIGVQNVKTMMEQMNGNSTVQMEMGYYAVILSFPIID